MKRPPAAFLLWAAIAASFLTLAPSAEAAGASSARKDRTKARAVVEYPFRGITVFSTNGKRLRRWEPKVDREGSEVRDVGYYAPHLHPNGDRFVCVKCVGRYADEKAYPLRPRSAACELTELSIDQEQEKILMPLTEGREVSSPAWSPDGATIAFVQDEAVVLYSVPDRRIARTIPAVVAATFKPVAPSGGLTPAEAMLWALKDPVARLRWASDGSSVFVHGLKPFPIEGLTEPLPEGMSEQPGVATVDLASGKVSWLNLYRPGGTRHVEIRDGKWTFVEGPLPAIEPIRALFGSEHQPRLSAGFASDGTSYLYVDPGSGLFWRDRLMRYDIAGNELSCVRTLARGLYSE